MKFNEYISQSELERTMKEPKRYFSGWDKYKDSPYAVHAEKMRMLGYEEQKNDNSGRL